MGALTTIGLMSGTSLDGIDVALIQTDGEKITYFGPSAFYAYDGSERDVLRSALKDAERISTRDDRPGVLADAEAVVTQSHERAVRAFMTAHNLKASDIDAIGFHGQTVLHRPENQLTVQIGNGAALATALAMPVVYDFRAQDVAAGGQGAPLVPVFHRALVEASDLEKPVAIVNIGGVANITLIDAQGEVSSFDTGPGNALIDDWVNEKAGLAFDVDGNLAACGAIDEELMEKLLSHPFFMQKPPKSLDRNWFTYDIVEHLPLADGAATLTAFTVRSILRALDYANFRPTCWIISGGGAQNLEIRRQLAELSGIDVKIADEFGWSSTFMEAQAFAFLAARSLRNLPLSFPTTTGVPMPMTGGIVAKPLAA
ncbi:anhydro-N-acetylmuramic acid kinase [Microvirga sp. W0021]|uniref:Anhydro-N-acetylmuramic acid kinase n=1 Tax=Hohaiivirga grylli TaxID=3133970 RepID=A0ABV0BJK4_9HYPH